MTRERLTRSNDWQLTNKEQDIRGWNVVDAGGNRIGVIDDLIFDTQSERVESIRLDDGSEYPADEIRIGEDVVYIEREAGEEMPVGGVYEDT